MDRGSQNSIIALLIFILCVISYYIFTSPDPGKALVIERQPIKKNMTSIKETMSNDSNELIDVVLNTDSDKNNLIVAKNNKNQNIKNKVQPLLAVANEKIKSTEVYLIEDNIKFQKGLNKKDDLPSVYIVEEGDTLTGISQKLFGSFRFYGEIRRFNNLSKGAILQLGQKLKVPIVKSKINTSLVETTKFDRIHKIISGESLAKISKIYYGKSSNWRKIYEANNTKIKDPNDLEIGLEIVIP